MRTLLVYVNGILNFPGSSKNWTGRAATFTQVTTDHWAEKCEYWCGPISRALGQRDRADKLRRTLSFYNGWDIHLVGHSNGADVILTALRDWPSPPIAKMHLVCGATESDFNKNGLNQWIGTGRVKEVVVYVAGQDKALKLAHSWPAKLLGYGVLGLHGPVNVLSSISTRVTTVTWPSYGHSDCWHDANFERTMDYFLPKPPTDASQSA